MTNNRKAVVFNMDPANENMQYEADVDIAELVNVESVATELSLGPNGGLLYAMEFLEKNLSWLEKKLAQHLNKYILFDFPGQVELYTHNDCIRNIIQKLLRKGHRVSRFIIRSSRTRRSLWNSYLICRTNRFNHSLHLSSWF